MPNSEVGGDLVVCRPELACGGYKSKDASPPRIGPAGRACGRIATRRRV